MRGSGRFFTSRKAPSGSQEWLAAGRYYFYAPVGMTSFCAVTLGAGGGTGGHDGQAKVGGTGGAGGLAYVNAIPCYPGELFYVTVGAPGAFGAPGVDGLPGGDSTIVRASNGQTVCAAGGGKPGGNAITGWALGGAGGGPIVGVGGYGGFGAEGNYNGNIGHPGGGGGAGGYAGNGGHGGYTMSNGRSDPRPQVGSGAGAGGYGAGFSGGGVGLRGKGSDGYTTYPQNPSSAGSGSGGGWNGSSSCTQQQFPGGARIVWGAGKSYPSNAT